MVTPAVSSSVTVTATVSERVRALYWASVEPEVVWAIVAVRSSPELSTSSSWPWTVTVCAESQFDGLNSRLWLPRSVEPEGTVNLAADSVFDCNRMVT